MDYEQRPWIIAIANQKGGQGKSTITVALAAVITEGSGTVLVADADPQGTVSWLARTAATPPPYETRSAFEPDQVAQLGDLRGFDTIVIDTPGNLTDTPMLAEVLKIADYAIVPVVPEAASVEPVLRTAQVIRQNNIPVRAMINQADPLRGAGPVEDFKALLGSHEVSYFQTAVRRYVAHSASQQEGVPITAYRRDRSWRPALEDIRKVHVELLYELGRLSTRVGA